MSSLRSSMLLTVGLATVVASCEAEVLPTTGSVRAETIHSSIVGDDYILRIRLPPGYEVDPARRYPLVVQLDPTFNGLREFDITCGYVSSHAAAGEWPEAIVVGPDYDDPNKRLRDYVLPDPIDPSFGGGNVDAFYRAMRDEILPYVEGRYRVDASRRVIVGHSAGATFVWYATFRHAPPEPPLFAGAVAADDGIEEGFFTYERWHAERTNTLPVRLFPTRAIYNGATQGIPFDALVDRIRARGYVGLEFEDRTYETDHFGAIRPSFEQGLAFALRGGP